MYVVMQLIREQKITQLNKKLMEIYLHL